MVKDKIIELENGQSYYVLDSITYNYESYFLAIECDLKIDEANINDYLIMKVDIQDDELKVKHIEDEVVATNVTNMFLKKIRSNN